MSSEQRAAFEFHEFFERHHRELSRFAYLLTGDRDAADDIAADAFASAWRRWDHVRSTDIPVAYMRRVVANLATSRLRRIVRERRGMGVLHGAVDDKAPGPDVPAVMDVRAALAQLPARKRACVVMRFAYDLSEEETANTLGVSVGTVKSQTSKAVAELARLLGHSPADDLAPASGLAPAQRPRPVRRRDVDARALLGGGRAT